MPEKKSDGAKPSKNSIKLEFPITFGKEEILEVSFRRPTATEIRHLTGDPDFGQYLDVAEKCFEGTPGALKKLDAVDAIRVGEMIAGFLTSTRGIGGGA